MKWIIAAYHAELIHVALMPYCVRCEVAGSVRRHAPSTNNIELVCIPRANTMQTLFGDAETVRDPRWIKAAKGIGRLLKGSLSTGHYIQFDRDGIQVDLFLATPENFGLIFAMRTGPAQYSHHVLASNWVRRGYRSVDGQLIRHGHQRVPVPDEQTLFSLIGLPYQEPQKRT